MTEPVTPSAGAVRPRKRGGRPPTYPWATTEPGACFLIDRTLVAPGTPTRLVYRQNRVERDRGTGRRWRLELDDLKGWRVWRIQ